MNNSLFDLEHTKITIYSALTSLVEGCVKKTSQLERGIPAVSMRQRYLLYSDADSYAAASGKRPADSILYFNHEQGSHILAMDAIKSAISCIVASAISRSFGLTEEKLFFTKGIWFYVDIALWRSSNEIMIDVTPQNVTLPEQCLCGLKRSLANTSETAIFFADSVVFPNEGDISKFSAQVDRLLKRRKFKGTCVILGNNHPDAIPSFYPEKLRTNLVESGEPSLTMRPISVFVCVRAKQKCKNQTVKPIMCKTYK